MQKFLFTAVILALAGSSVRADDPKAIVEKAIKAHGGEEVLNKYPASKSQFKLEMGVGGMDLTFEGTSIQAPGKLKLDMVTTIMGQKLVILQSIKGKEFKTKVKVGDMDVSMEASDSEKEEAQMGLVDAEIQRFTPLLDAKKFDLRAEKEEEVEGKKVNVITVTPKEKKEVKLYFDKESGLLVKTARQGLIPGDAEKKEGLLESYMSEYKKIDGIMVSMKVVVNANGNKSLTLTSSEHTHLEKVDDKEFDLD
jgi:hypothetical protein